MTPPFHAGYIAIIGRPNVGKSTLLNALIGEKVSIVSPKAQTTRYAIRGIKTTGQAQLVFIDTPGFNTEAINAMHRVMNRSVRAAITEVDVIVFMIDARGFTDQDEEVLKKLSETSIPVILVLNKIDLIKDKTQLLPFIEKLALRKNFAEIIPISSAKLINLDKLEKIITKLLPEQDALFAKEQLTDREDKFFMAEIIREKIMRATNQEVPYGAAVTIDQVKQVNKSVSSLKDVLHINATIWVERDGQKVIILGKKGEGLKFIGQKARLELERKFKQKIFLTLWIKVKENWSDDQKLLSQLGM